MSLSPTCLFSRRVAAVAALARIAGIMHLNCDSNVFGWYFEQALSTFDRRVMLVPSDFGVALYHFVRDALPSGVTEYWLRIDVNPLQCKVYVRYEEVLE